MFSPGPSGLPDRSGSARELRPRAGASGSGTGHAAGGAGPGAPPQNGAKPSGGPSSPNRSPLASPLASPTGSPARSPTRSPVASPIRRSRSRSSHGSTVHSKSRSRSRSSSSSGSSSSHSSGARSRRSSPGSRIDHDSHHGSGTDDSDSSSDSEPELESSDEEGLLPERTPTPSTPAPATTTAPKVTTSAPAPPDAPKVGLIFTFPTQAGIDKMWGKTKGSSGGASLGLDPIVVEPIVIEDSEEEDTCSPDFVPPPQPEGGGSSGTSSVGSRWFDRPGSSATSPPFQFLACPTIKKRKFDDESWRRMNEYLQNLAKNRILPGQIKDQFGYLRTMCPLKDKDDLQHAGRVAATYVYANSRDSDINHWQHRARDMVRLFGFLGLEMEPGALVHRALCVTSEPEAQDLLSYYDSQPTNASTSHAGGASNAPGQAASHTPLDKQRATPLPPLRHLSPSSTVPCTSRRRLTPFGVSSRSSTPLLPSTPERPLSCR